MTHHYPLSLSSPNSKSPQLLNLPQYFFYRIERRLLRTLSVLASVQVITSMLQRVPQLDSVKSWKAWRPGWVLSPYLTVSVWSGFQFWSISLWRAFSCFVFVCLVCSILLSTARSFLLICNIPLSDLRWTTPKPISSPLQLVLLVMSSLPLIQNRDANIWRALLVAWLQVLLTTRREWEIPLCPPCRFMDLLLPHIGASSLYLFMSSSRILILPPFYSYLKMAVTLNRPGGDAAPAEMSLLAVLIAPFGEALAATVGESDRTGWLDRLRIIKTLMILCELPFLFQASLTSSISTSYFICF